jgi:FKBP-type peptidyl-prolyl cis-trans isomerase
MRKFLVDSSWMLCSAVLSSLLQLTIGHPDAIAGTNIRQHQPLQNTIAAATKKAPQTITTPSGLKYTILKAGKGATPKPGQEVFVHYTGTLTSGKKFDSSRDKGQPFSFKVGAGQVIPGWDEALSTMKVGERRKLTIPPKLGYGAAGAGGVIPPNATLIFDVELLKLGE